MHRTEPTRLQSLALQLAEKMASLVDQNERMLEMKTTGPGYFNYPRQGMNVNVVHKVQMHPIIFNLHQTSRIFKVCNTIIDYRVSRGH